MKTVEQLFSEKKMLETKIQGLINAFYEENPNVEIDINFSYTKIEGISKLPSIHCDVQIHL